MAKQWKLLRAGQVSDWLQAETIFIAREHTINIAAQYQLWCLHKYIHILSHSTLITNTAAGSNLEINEIKSGVYSNKRGKLQLLINKTSTRLLGSLLVIPKAFTHPLVFLYRKTIVNGQKREYLLCAKVCNLLT